MLIKKYEMLFKIIFYGNVLTPYFPLSDFGEGDGGRGKSLIFNLRNKLI
jgi:hypothetical protein